MLVLTIDQRHSRRGDDLVAELLTRLNRDEAPLTRRFERTAGDEGQGIVADSDYAVDLVLGLVRSADWSVGIGLGEVREPLPDSVRAASGAAFENARVAVQKAKSSPRHLRVVGPDPAAAEEADALLSLLAAVVQRRTSEGWEVVELLAQGHTQRHIAARLGISSQAVSQRVRVALWAEESRTRPLAARLLRAADR